MTILESLRIDFFMPRYQQDPQTLLKSACESRVLKLAFLSKYKELPPIEDFPAEEKKEWKIFVHELFPGKDVQFKLDAVKIIYTIGVLSNE